MFPSTDATGRTVLLEGNLTVGDTMAGATHTNVHKAITKYGHAVVTTMGRVPYAYTVGLTRPLGFELLMYGVVGDLAFMLLNNAADALNRQCYEDGEDISKVIESHSVRLRSLLVGSNPDLMWRLSMIWSFGFSPDRIRVVTWKDEAGRFPGEPGYSHEVKQTISELKLKLGFN